MKKYWIIAKNTWEETMIYRLNFTMWRIRNILSLLTIYFLWFAILPQNTSFAGYNQSLMLTYILGTSLISSIVLSSRSTEVGDQINQGDLSNFLMKPFNYFYYWFARDLGDKAMNIFFSIGELLILFFILRPPLFIQNNIFYLFPFLIATATAVILYFFFSFILGLIGFWTPEIWAPRFIFMISLNFFAGGLFPLDILPKPIFDIFQLLPFPYLLYFPLKIYLGQLAFSKIYTGILVSIVWTAALYFVMNFIWKKGLKNYASEGR